MNSIMFLPLHNVGLYHKIMQNAFCTKNLRGIKWQDKIPDTEVLTRADLASMFTILGQSRLRWAGHVDRMSIERLPKKLLFGELQQASLKASLKAVSPRESSVAINCPQGCQSITNRTAVAKERRQARKNRANNPTAAATIPCPHCQRLFPARIGLTSHLRTNRARLPLHQDE